MSEATGSTESAENLYEILKSKIDILRKWAENLDNAEYKDRVNTLVYGFNKLNSTDKDAIANFNKAVADVITYIPRDKLPPELNESSAITYDGGRRRKSASSSSRPRRRSSKKRSTQRKQKRRQRRGSRRAY